MRFRQPNTAGSRSRALRRAPAISVALLVVVGLLVGPATAADAPGPVLVPTAMMESTVPEQNPAEVSERVGKLATSEPMGKQTGTVIIDAASQETLYDNNAGNALIPASSIKIATAAAAMGQVGVNTRIDTTVVRAPGSDTVYLVGGGDPLLESKLFKKDSSAPKYPAATSMNKLAKDAAATLKAAGLSTITLKYDASLFTGPDWNADWPRYFRTQGIVSPVSALMVDDGRITQWQRGEDPAKHAADRFAALLQDEGIKAKSVSNAKAPANAEKVAVVSSVPIYEIASQMLSTSDNDTAEALFRLAGVSGGFGGSFTGGKQATEAVLSNYGIPTAAATFDDGSGLSKQDKVSPLLLGQILVQSLRGENDLWPIGSGLAIGGVSGTLKFRFDDATTDSVAGLARAKTGTLTSISSLSGFVMTKSGRVFVYSSIANDAKSAFEAAAKMDEIVAAMGGCGCP